MEEKEQSSLGTLIQRARQLVSKRRAIIAGVFLLIAASLVFGFTFRKPSQDRYIQEQRQDTYREGGKQTQSNIQTEWPVLWGPPDSQNRCQNIPSAKYKVLPVAIEDIKFVQPIGELREGHIIPGDHGGIDYKTSPSTTPVKVFMPADGFLVRVEKHPYDPPAGYPKDLQHYHIYLEHSCTLFTGFVHLTEFAPEVLAASGELGQLTKDRSTQQKQAIFRIPLKAGQQIGTAWSFGLLGMVTVDLNVTNKGYLKPESYQAENWRIHSVPGIDYFEEPLKTQILAKNPRTAQPRGGKIDFDIEGKLVGNWFQQGSGGFRDDSIKPKQCGNWPCPYWEGHLALVYDYIDPTQLRVSVGFNHGLSSRTPFGVKGNTPDFKNIGAADGPVKYELVGLKDISRERGYDTESPLITVNDESSVLGTMLAQVVDKDTIKVEIFPGKIAGQVNEFSANAKIYHR